MLFVKVKNTNQILKVINYNISDGISTATTLNGDKFIIGVDANLILENDSPFNYGQDYYFYDRVRCKIYKGFYKVFTDNACVMQSDVAEHYIHEHDIFEDFEDIYPPHLKKYENRKSYNYSDAHYESIKLNKNMFGFFSGRIQKLKLLVKYNDKRGFMLTNEKGAAFFVNDLAFRNLENNPKDFLTF